MHDVSSPPGPRRKFRSLKSFSSIHSAFLSRAHSFIQGIVITPLPDGLPSPLAGIDLGYHLFRVCLPWPSTSSISRFPGCQPSVSCRSSAPGPGCRGTMERAPGTGAVLDGTRTGARVLTLAAPGAVGAVARGLPPIVDSWNSLGYFTKSRLLVSWECLTPSSVQSQEC